MLRITCVSCRREYKTVWTKGQQVSHGLCGQENCQLSFELWLALPPVLRGRLQDFHNERLKLRGVA